MTTNSNDSRDAVFKLNQLVVEDLLNTSESNLRAEVAQNPALKQKGVEAKEAYQTALQTVGKSRLANARKQMESAAEITTHSIDLASARLELAKLIAANDPQVTIAARNLDSLSDSETIELVNELIALGAIKKDWLF